jgi:hypothetical protein
VTTLLRNAITALVATDPERIVGGEVTLDSLAVPYGSASLELPLTPETTLDDLDPRDDARIEIDAADTIGGTTRSFNLGIRSRTVDYTNRTVSIEAATDEALLEDYASLTTDTGARAHEGSVRAVVNYVLARIGAVLEAGTPNPPVTAFWNVTNFLTNPDVAGGVVTPWTSGGNCTLFYSTSGADGTLSSCGVQSSAAGLLAVVPHTPGQGPSVTPGTSYVFTGMARQNEAGTSRTFYPVIRWLNQSGAPVAADVEAPPMAMSNTVWQRKTLIATAPPGASRAEVFFRSGGGTAAGQFMYIDRAMFYEGSELIPFYDGETPDSSTYVYAWTGATNASTSTRTAVVERPPELFVWKPGTTAWDFLAPFLASTGLRLYCDEHRDWRLIDPATYEIPGFIRLSGLNATAASDTISRDDPDVFATGVVIRYVWEDADGIPRTAYDVAGDPDVVVVFDYARAFPGPGAAAAILARRDGTGRTQSVDTLVDWTLTPGMTASIVLPDTPEQQGKVTSLRFSLGDDALMSVGTRGLIDIPAGSWLAWTPPDQAWNAVADSVTWISLPA